MIILSDCMHEIVDEGCIKVANSLVRLIKKNNPKTMVISYNRKNVLTDVYLNLNKLFLNLRLFKILRKKKEPVLYIPQAANSMGSIIRIWILSRIMHCKVSALFVDYSSMNAIAQFLLKKSGSKIVALSRDSCDKFKKNSGNPVLYLKVGVDTNRFFPVSEQQKLLLREKYNVAKDEKVLLHVGHLTRGRNIEQMLKANEEWKIYIVVSTHTAASRDGELRQELLKHPNVTIVDTYVENIEEIYQMADIYFFPVIEAGNCISAPLSVFEAAACNIPIVTTKYGNLVDFIDEPGFCFLESFDADEINRELLKMSAEKNFNNREAIFDYDWNKALDALLAFILR